LSRYKRILYVGSFSKALSASPWCGYVAGAPDTIRSLVDLKMITMVATSLHAEHVVLETIESGQYLKNRRRLCGSIKEGAKATTQALLNVGLDVPLPEVQKFYLWVPLPARLDEAGFCLQAARTSIFLASGQGLSCSSRKPGPACNARQRRLWTDLRLCTFLRSEIENIEKGLTDD
jgi:DNA-binding transcriptional MocR family regulator